jgi:bifunctional non-homologous end joining protein LigD
LKLESYRKKRDAERTNEPLGDEPDAKRPTWRGAFVVHQHDATRMHFDLRLEIGGVLASFAIPKGPTLDPEAKHLAVHTEDHPIEYLDFEAVVPEGNYGAGPMIVWDFGVARYLDESAEDGLRSGKLHFSLEGRKLHGRFALVRVKSRTAPKTKPEDSREWLFFKKTDVAASKRDIVAELPRSVLSGLTVAELGRMPAIAAEIEKDALSWGAKQGALDGRTLSPMLCTLGDVPKDAGWLHELKLDGVRVVATKDARGVDLFYRSGRSASASYPEVVRATQALAPTSVVLDGEIVSFDESGKPSFERLASRIHATPRADLRHALGETPVVFVVFDLLAIGGTVLLDLPLSQRKALLARLVPGNGVLRALDHLDGGGDKLFAFCRDNGLEGVVSKRASSTYHPGPGRTGDWVKTKCETESLFVVVGFTSGERSRGRLGALDLATYDGDTLVLRGRAGSGLTDAIIDDLLPRLGPLTTDAPTATGTYDPAPRGRTHVRPELVVRVRYLEWSEEGSLRFPVFLALEHDADPLACRAAPHDESHASPPPADPEAAPPIEVRITNRQKPFWPEDGLTKGDLVDYYEAIAPTLLPYLVDRPVMLVRYPDGIDGKSFYQWNVPHGMPPWVRSVVLGKHVESPDEGDNQKHVFLIDRVESLLYVANLACIPIHVLASRVASPKQCDFLTIDFDVNLSSLRVAIDLAHTLRGLLDQVGLTGFPKTSGQSGLHVHVPMGAGVTPTAARTFADLLGRLIVDRHPNDATMERAVGKRGAKVYVDTGQTGPSRTIVAPYSVRATRGARVATPLGWEEVVPELDPGAFTIRTVPARVAARGDPMRPMLESRPDMARVVERLAALVPGKR